MVTKEDLFECCCYCVGGTCALLVTICGLCCLLPIVIALYVLFPPLVILIMSFIPSFKQTGTWKFLESQDLYFKADDAGEGDGHVEQPCFYCYRGEFRAFLICVGLCVLFWIPGVCWAIGITIHGLLCLLK